ncbi:MAG: YggS family pyridoxal phosphate-dependent enzyme [Armatimonadetes bacterium]|nr:YggS family pyridoxal phosphate-dependent enzyme [Armatimonadota bacterium]
MTEKNIKERIDKLSIRINTVAEHSGRNPESIKLIAVTKTRTPETIDSALKYGIEFIGENKVQEAEQKLPFLKEKYKEFHFVGHLQSNKIHKLMKLHPTLIHSIDKFSTAEKLNEYLSKKDKKQDILIQVNTSEEQSKFGIHPDETLDFIKKISLLSNLKIRGLMTIGIFSDNENKIRKCFQILRKIFEKIKAEKNPIVEMKYLSMGMTNDFEIAIQEGANIIRIGTAIFGIRNL